MSSLWVGLNDDLLSCICQVYGPVYLNASDRQQIGKVLKVLTTLSRLFESLKYIGTIEVDEVLAYYLLLSELAFVKKRYPEELGNMLTTWLLPKGNLTLSLLVWIRRIGESTLDSLAAYIPYISDRSARLTAVNYCLDLRASGSMSCVEKDWRDNYRKAIHSAFEVRVVIKSKQRFTKLGYSSAFIAGSLLHFTPAELNGTLVNNGLNEALDEVAASKVARHWTCEVFVKCPIILRDSYLMLAIFERNIQAFQTIPFAANQRIIMSVINKIKSGSPQDMIDMSEAERKALFDMFLNRNLELVFYIWAREDFEKYCAWEQFAKDSSNSSIPSRLAFDLEGFFENHFSADLFEGQNPVFCLLLEEFKYYPNCRKKVRFHELLRAKVQEGSETKRALSGAIENFKCLVNFFIDQSDNVGLEALNSFVYHQIKDALDKYEFNFELLSSTVRSCQLFYGHVDGVDSLGLLAKRLGAAKVLHRLDFSRLRANDVGEILSILGISPEQMNAALSSLSHEDKPEDELEDELVAVLTEFQNYDLSCSLMELPSRHSLWFYLWKEHQEAFVAHVHPKIKQHYLPEESKLPEPVC